MDASPGCAQPSNDSVCGRGKSVPTLGRAHRQETPFDRGCGGIFRPQSAPGRRYDTLTVANASLSRSFPTRFAMFRACFPSKCPSI